MPLYEYRCHCGSTMDRHVPVSERDTRIVDCQSCGSPMRRCLFSLSVKYRMGRQGLLQAAGIPNDGVHRVHHNPHRSTFGPGGKVERAGGVL